MRYLKQMIVLRQHAFQLQEKYQILLQIKNKATAGDIAQLDAELNSVQDELLGTNSAIDVLNGLV